MLFIQLFIQRQEEVQCHHLAIKQVAYIRAMTRHFTVTYQDRSPFETRKYTYDSF